MNFLVNSSSSTLVGERKEGVARLEFTNEKIVHHRYGCNMINNSSLQKWDRLAQKNLDSQFTHEIIHGLNCSPYEAAAILESVYKIYTPYFQTSGSLKPGQILFQVIAIDARASTRLSESKQVTVTLTLDDPREDLAIRKQSGVVGLRCHRIQRVCTETYQQGGLLTVEDLANRLLNCGERTICRDLQTLRKKNIIVPLRSTIKDMGRTISHRTVIVKEWLRGKEYSDISRNTFHSVASVRNYIEKFKRVVALTHENYDVHTIAFLVKLSAPLVEEYFRLYRECPAAAHRKQEMRGFIKKNSVGIHAFGSGKISERG
jgi:hypothetical protein